jgi:hypothetical protein
MPDITRLINEWRLPPSAQSTAERLQVAAASLRVLPISEMEFWRSRLRKMLLAV